METSLKKQKNKVKNIPIRNNSSSEINSSKSKHLPEASYILKYCPKYYKRLAPEIKPSRSLLSKFKKIKKLKSFTGVFQYNNLPQNLWFNLFANTRKELEEYPEVNDSYERPMPFLPEKFIMKKVKFFPNVKRILFGKEKFDSCFNFVTNLDDWFPIKELFVRYLRGLRIKNLEINFQNHNCDQTEWIIEKFDKMKGMLKKPEIFSMKIGNEKDVNIEKLFQNRNLFSHLTDLCLSGKFDLIFGEIPHICKNLKSLSLIFSTVKPEFQKLLNEIRNLPRLESLDLSWPKEIRNFWGHFKSQSRMKRLKLRLNISELRNKDLFHEGLKDLEKQWEGLEELDSLELDINSQDVDDMISMRLFITVLLKKICKLRSFKCEIQTPLVADGSVRYEPFLVQEVAHLYGSLEEFNFWVNDSLSEEYAQFDFRMMRIFKNLKVFKLKGTQIFDESIGDIVNLLQKNKGSLLELGSKLRNMMCFPDWLEETIRTIAEVKRVETSLKVRVDLSFENSDSEILVEELCEIMQLVKNREDIMVNLTLDDEEVYSGFIEKDILQRRYSDIKNLVVVVKDQKNVYSMRRDFTEEFSRECE